MCCPEGSLAFFGAKNVERALMWISGVHAPNDSTARYSSTIVPSDNLQSVISSPIELAVRDKITAFCHSRPVNDAILISSGFLAAQFFRTQKHVIPDQDFR
jgi:hypothetical protein